MQTKVLCNIICPVLENKLCNLLKIIEASHKTDLQRCLAIMIAQKVARNICPLIFFLQNKSQEVRSKHLSAYLYRYPK